MKKLITVLKEANHHSHPHTHTLATHIHTYTQAFRSREAQMCEELESAVERARAEGDAEVRTSVKRDLVLKHRGKQRPTIIVIPGVPAVCGAQLRILRAHQEVNQ